VSFCCHELCVVQDSGPVSSGVPEQDDEVFRAAPKVVLRRSIDQATVNLLQAYRNASYVGWNRQKHCSMQSKPEYPICAGSED